MAFNEEANITHAITTILDQRLTTARVLELIVVASGCTDRTAEIVASIARLDTRVRLIEQERREGKASAVNLFIESARAPVLVMAGADVVLRDGAIDELLRHFEDPTTGMVGGHPVPVNDETTFLGHAAHLLWRLHDRLARASPKLGEVVAFRNVVPSIPLDTAVDEISIQALISQLGYRVVYEPNAIVYNRGPSTIRDFLRQRRRIYAGHLRVRRQQEYAASTMSVRRILRALRGSGSFSSPRAALWTLCTIGLETLARVLGHYDRMRRQSHQVWDAVLTTKHHVAEGASEPGRQNVLVFHIIDFHRRQLEIGAHAYRQLTNQLLRHLQEGLGAGAVVALQRNGIIVALIPGESKRVHATARGLVESFATAPSILNGHGDCAGVRLGFGMLSFSPAGQASQEVPPDAVQVPSTATLPGVAEHEGTTPVEVPSWA
jgi:hypothetical protein